MQGIGKYIPVVGVDAIAAGCDAISNGIMLGNSLNNPVKLAQSIYKLMYLLENGQEVTTETVDIEGVTVEDIRLSSVTFRLQTIIWMKHIMILRQQTFKI